MCNPIPYFMLFPLLGCLFTHFPPGNSFLLIFQGPAQAYPPWSPPRSPLRFTAPWMVGPQLPSSLEGWIFRASLQFSSQPDFLAQCLAQNSVLELTEHEMVLKNKLWLKDKQGKGGVTGLLVLLPQPRCRHSGLILLGGPASPSGPLH